jgi:DNA-binding NarL/FixJ family response regulator
MIFCVMNEHAERREGLKALLRQVNRQATALDARDWHQAERVVSRAEPDLFVIDWQAPEMQSADLSSFMREHPRMPAAILADDAAHAAVATFMHAGVLGVIPRDLAPRLIVRAFELVMLGGYYVPARALDLDLPNTTQFRQQARPLPKRHDAGDSLPLSPRQHQIMRLVHLGNTNKVIARALGISEGTVKIHLSSAFRLLGATNRAAAVAIYNGWQYEQLSLLNDPAAAVRSRARQPDYAEAPPRPHPVDTGAPRRHERDLFRSWLFAAEPTPHYDATAPVSNEGDDEIPPRER